MNIASPRDGSPPVAAAARMRRSFRSSIALMITPATKVAAAMPRSIPAPLLADADGMSALIAEPPMEEPQCRGPMNQPARDPHHQSGKLLVSRRIEADPGHPHSCIGRVP